MNILCNEGDVSMIKTKKGFIVRLLMVITFFVLLAATLAQAYDASQVTIESLDAKTFVITKEFASEIKIYLCHLEDSKVVVDDACSIPYMTLEHRNLFEKQLGGVSPTSTEQTPIIKKIQ